MSEIAKTLIFLGIFLVIAGGVLLLLGKIPGMGKLPGDIVIKKENFTFYFPLATCLLLSALLSLFFYLMNQHR